MAASVLALTCDETRGWAYAVKVDGRVEATGFHRATVSANIDFAAEPDAWFAALHDELAATIRTVLADHDLDARSTVLLLPDDGTLAGGLLPAQFISATVQRAGLLFAGAVLVPDTFIKSLPSLVSQLGVRDGDKVDDALNQFTVSLMYAWGHAKDSLARAALMMLMSLSLANMLSLPSTGDQARKRMVPSAQDGAQEDPWQDRVACMSIDERLHIASAADQWLRKGMPGVAAQQRSATGKAVRRLIKQWKSGAGRESLNHPGTRRNGGSPFN